MRKKRPRIQKKETASDRSRLNLDRTALVITNGKVTGATVNIGGELGLFVKHYNMFSMFNFGDVVVNSYKFQILIM